MRCIGDECTPPRNAAVPTPPFPLMRSVAVGALCAGLGYALAQSLFGTRPEQHVAGIAPPLVMVSEIGE